MNIFLNSIPNSGPDTYVSRLAAIRINLRLALYFFQQRCSLEGWQRKEYYNIRLSMGRPYGLA